MRLWLRSLLVVCITSFVSRLIFDQFPDFLMQHTCDEDTYIVEKRDEISPEGRGAAFFGVEGGGGWVRLELRSPLVVCITSFVSQLILDQFPDFLMQRTCDDDTYIVEKRDEI